MKKKIIRAKLASAIVSLYYASIFSKGVERDYATKRRHQKSLKELTPTERKHFLATAEVVRDLDADPREYVIAQFQAFAEYSAFAGRYLLPMPHQMHTLAAVVRYQRYKGQQELRETRTAPIADKATDAFFREERKLSGLVRMTRRMPV